MLINIRHGLDVSMPGKPQQVVDDSATPDRVAVIGHDYPGVRPSLMVQEGDRVAKGDVLFADRAVPAICVTAPQGGRVREINRGPRRGVVSVVIEREDCDARRFASHPDSELCRLGADEVRQTLQAAGLWPAFRLRPLGTPAPQDTPVEVFVTAIDTDPLAADPGVVVAEAASDFARGLSVLSALAEKTVYLCCAPGFSLPEIDVAKLVVARLQGPHPAGLPGTHLHYLNGNRAPRGGRWQIDYQDVIAIGHVFSQGELPDERIVALAGSAVHRPRLLRVVPGAELSTLLDGELAADGRVIAGSVLSGRQTNPATHYLGRSHNQVAVLVEPETSEVQTGMLAVESLERVWPFRVPPLPLLRALLIQDTETAMALGCMDLAVEDLALCTYVCPAGLDYGRALRQTLQAIERRG
jgi:Na+-transporting NADH:ubiquinone oxidoreductase subunit A